ncbi:D-glycero-beta-D-manno-heptose 1,7-bisphosphate 7-phosphatase [uncultured Aquabacterium sp.]|uniref:D-glycero-beta-D-manno-heptose 1,7-bisphosphate 7-phosphatase n=1 Tax=uncultured Aquabacterium sp. TaxID=158753 RepID=UPI00262D906E|nr:D-glycero-beta-D-manno-heptose 1,7-bisphosphate 7-phosphatase [uncultured Aquabacterium sp.]
MARPLVILDRDGVVNHDSPLYVRSAEAWTPIDGAIEAIATMCRAGYDVVIATNQAGVAKGLIPVAELDQMHRKLEALVDAAGGQIARIYDCRHHPDHGCGCRKPQPGMLLKACLDFGQRPEAVCFVGDALTDMVAAARAGCQPVLVLTGKGQATQALAEFDPTIPVLGSLAEVPGWLARRGDATLRCPDIRTDGLRSCTPPPAPP